MEIITCKNSSTNIKEKGKETFVHVVIQSVKDHINSLGHQLKDKQKIIDRLFFNSINRSHQEQKLAENVKGLSTSTNDIIKADISTNNNENAITENNHILENNNKFNLNRRDKLLKKGNTDKEYKSRISDLTVVYYQNLLHRS